MTAQPAHKVGTDYLPCRRESSSFNKSFWLPFSLVVSYILSQTYLVLFR